MLVRNILSNTHLENENIFGIASEYLFPQERDKNFDMTQEGRQNFRFYL